MIGHDVDEHHLIRAIERRHGINLGAHFGRRAQHRTPGALRCIGMGDSPGLRGLDAGHLNQLIAHKVVEHHPRGQRQKLRLGARRRGNRPCRNRQIGRMKPTRRAEIALVDFGLRHAV